jgi:hypothetical protein
MPRRALKAATMRVICSLTSCGSACSVVMGAAAAAAVQRLGNSPCIADYWVVACLGKI